MEFSYEELMWIEEQIEEAWNDLRHYPDDYVSTLISVLYSKVQDAKRELKRK